MAIVIPSARIAYFPVPKSACTSLKSLFFEIENGFPFKPMQRNGAMFHIHNFYGTRPFSAHDPASTSDCWRIAVWRDPIKRFLSCYSNRVMHFRELSSQMLSTEAIEGGATPDPGLEVFVEKLEIYRKYSTSIRHHTAPQVFFLGKQPDYFSRIYHMDELSMMVRDVERRVGRALSLPHEQRGGPKLLPSDLSANAIEKLRSFYRADYRHLEPAIARKSKEPAC